METSLPSWAEDEAMALAAADPRNGVLLRAGCWLAWAYNRSPLRVFLDLTSAPLLFAEGILPPFWRWLVFLALPPGRATDYRQAARALSWRSSGWLGCFVVLPVWIGFSLLVLWLILASL